MKITIISPVFPFPNRGILGGPERFVENLSEKLRDLGHTIRIVTTYWNGGKRIEIYKGIPILRVLDTKALFGSIGTIGCLTFYSFGLNIILKRNFKYYSDSELIILSLAIGFTSFFKQKKIPVISIYHHYDTPISLREFLFLPFFHQLEKRTFKKHELIVSRTESAREELSRIYGIKKKKIQIISDGVNLDKFNPSNNDSEIRKKYGENILLYIGHFFPRKRVQVLIKAMPNLLKEIINVHLLLGGNGETINECKNLVKSLGLENKVTFLGFVDEERLPNYLATSDLFIFPSEKEGFGQVIIEAMASGTPVICANKEPMSKLIEDGGITFELNNSEDLSKKIIYLLKDKKRILELQQNAIKVSEKYDYTNIAKKYVSCAYRS